MKKFLSIGLILTVMLSSTFRIVLADDIVWEETSFIVTAYYSPLPNQDNYLTWDYYSEKVLNWEWIKWASGKPVFSWMLAAPTKYNFGTKIYLEWLWVGSVEDRGGAIVESWKRWYEYDRIDLWVWYGDEWLKRALYWWKRVVKWKVVSSWEEVSINHDEIPAPDWVTKNLENLSGVFAKWIWDDSSVSDIKELQTFLKDVWVYNGKVDWNYSKIYDIVLDFQLEYWIVKDENTYWAGYWWVKTRKKFREVYVKWDLDDNLLSENDISEDIEDVLSDREKILFANVLEWTDNVKLLQEILKEMSLYRWKIDWNYNSVEGTVLMYQLARRVISDSSDLWSGNFWPQTRSSLKKDYWLFLIKNGRSIEEEKQDYVSEEKLVAYVSVEDEIRKLKELSYKESEEIVENLWQPRFWESSDRVRELQVLLKKLWYFDYEDTAFFGNITKESIVKFQLENSVISSRDEMWAWVFWPKTRGQFKDSIAEFLLKEKMKEKWMLDEDKGEVADNQNMG